MKDYFASLASRVLQAERSIQPRPRVPFESTSRAAVDVNESFSDVRQRESTLPTTPKAASSRKPSGDVERFDERLPHAEPAVGNRPRPTAHRASSRQDSAHNEARTRPDNISFFVHPSVVERPAARDSNARRGSLQSEPQAAGAVHTQKAAPRPTSVPGARLGSDAAVRTTTPDSPAADPVIRIHIGRVDVRAVQAPPAQTPARGRDARRDLMTLDAYVRQRRGERP